MVRRARLLARERDRSEFDDDAGYAKRFGRHVRSFRRARGLTQEVLAQRCELAADTIRRLERGEFSPSLDTLRAVCWGLQIRVGTLFESFDLGERMLGRELDDALVDMSPEVRDAFLRFTLALARERGEG